MQLEMREQQVSVDVSPLDVSPTRRPLVSKTAKEVSWGQAKVDLSLQVAMRRSQARSNATRPRLPAR